MPATGQCRLRDGDSSIGTCWVSVLDRLRTSSLIVVQASSAATKHAPAATVMATGNAGCHGGRVLKGGAGKPRGQGKGGNRDHLTEARERVVNGGSDPGVP